MTDYLLRVVAAVVGLVGSICLAYSFKASMEADFLTRPFRWGPGTAIRFNRGLFRLGVVGITSAVLVGVLR